MTPGGSDISVWLQNKLGTTNDTWNVGSIVGQLNSEILEKIIFVFQDLHVQVRLFVNNFKLKNDLIRNLKYRLEWKLIFSEE